MSIEVVYKMSTRNNPNTSSTTTMGEALAGTQKWSHSRNQWIMDPTLYPGTVLQDTFANATGDWFGILASGAGTGSINPQYTGLGNTDGNSMRIQASANTRFLAVRKFDITPAKKLGVNLFFCYDNPANVGFIHAQLQWRDVDHALTHTAAYRYNTALNQWQYLPNTSASASGAFVSLAGATTTLASGAGAWHELYFDVDYNANTYDEFISGQIGIANPGSGLGILTTLETTEAQRMEILLGVETTSAGTGNVWIDDVTVLEVD